MDAHSLFGFWYKGKYYLVYNHYDPYLQGLGATVIKQLKYAIDNNLLNEWKSKIIELKEVDDKIDLFIQYYIKA